MSIGKKLVTYETLSFQEAMVVMEDLEALCSAGRWCKTDKDTGKFIAPEWAIHVRDHYQLLSAAHAMVQQLAWRAIAKTLHSTTVKMQNAIGDTLETMELQEKRETGEFHWSAEAFRPVWDNSKRLLRECLDDVQQDGGC